MTNEQANVKVTLNSQEAQRELENLQGKMKRLIALKKKAEEQGDVQGYKRIDGELKKVNREANKLVREHQDLDRIIKNISGASINDLRKAQRALTAQTNKLNRNTDEYVKKKAQLKLVRNEIAKVNAEYRSQGSFISRAATGLNKYFSIITAGAASFAGLILGARNAINSFNEFEETVSNLRALTGLGAEEMKYLEDQAKKTSVETIEGGVRIKQSAKDIVDAYTLVGSKRPELLKNKEALHEVTREAIILSEAAKMELGPAAGALAITMNQFELSADKARMVINSLAAGSQAGAGNIEYISQAIEKAGTTFNIMGLSVEQTVGAIETIAPFFSEASEAGNTLDKTLLQMRKNNIGYQSGVFNLNDAILELEQRFANGETAVDLFGVRHAKAAELLVKNKDEFNRYTQAVTGTNKAIEQASVNTDNNNAKLAQARNRIALVKMELGEKLSPVYASIISKSSLMLKLIGSLVDIFTKYGHIILISTAAIVGYAIAVKLAARWDSIHYGLLVAQNTVKKTAAFLTGVLTGKIKLATVAQKAWNLVQKANPIGLIGGLIAGAIVAIVAFTKKVDSLTAAQKALNDVEKAAKQNIVEQKLEIESLLRTAKNEKLSLDQRKEALKELNKISPEYFGNLTLEKLNTQEAEEATRNYTNALLEQARVEAAKEKLIELEKERIDALTEGTDSQLSFFEKIKKGYTVAGAAVDLLGKRESTIRKEQQWGAEKANQAAANYNKTKEALIGIIDKETEAIKNQKKETVDQDETEIDSAIPSGNFEPTKKALESAFTQEQNILKQQFLEKKLTQSEFNQEMYSLELAHLTAMRELYRRHGEDVISIEGQIIDKKMAWQSQFEKMMETSSQLTEKITQDERKMFADIDKEMDKHLDDYTKNLDKETQAVIEAKIKEKKAYEAARDAAIFAAVESGMAAVENAETIKEAGKAILNMIHLLMLMKMVFLSVKPVSLWLIGVIKKTVAALNIDVLMFV